MSSSHPVTPAGPTLEAASARWRMLALLSLAELLGMSLWFTASASASHFRDLWDLSAGQVSGLTTAVQLGFVAGTAVVALLSLADVLPSRWLFSASALAAALCNLLVLEATSYPTALALRFGTGVLLAGVYPPAMKMTATWFKAGRGLAIGTLVGALTVGKAAPYLVHALFGSVHPNFVIGSTSAGAVLAGVLVLAGYRDGPHAFPPRRFDWGLVAQVVRHRETRLAIGGYLGHMWELYAVWTFAALFFFDFFQLRGYGEASALRWSGIVGFAVIGAGALGCVVAGAWADRLGREKVTMAAMAASGACSLLMGWLLHAPLGPVLALALFWGFAVVADSAQFSAVITEVAPPHAVGTSLTLQTSLGFLLTTVTIQGVPVLRDALGWPLAFGILALGPAAGIVAMHRLRALRAR